MRRIISILFVACLIATVLITGACGNDDDSGSDPGALPVLKTGETWTERATIDDVEYTIVFTMVGEETVSGKDVYVVEGKVEPPIAGMADTISNKFDKENMLPLEGRLYGGEEGSGLIDFKTTYSYEISGAPLYPVKVGNVTTVVTTEFTVTTMNGETETETDTYTEIYKVEAIEDITVPAGTFTCFKIVTYDENNVALETTWQSEATKHFNVKELDNETGEIAELISYSVSD